MSQRLGSALLAAVLCCAPAWGEPPARPAAANKADPANCPYRTLFVYWEMNPDVLQKADRQLSARLASAFAREMEKRGFRIAGDSAWLAAHRDAEGKLRSQLPTYYWLTYSQAGRNIQFPGSFVWMAHTQALNDLQGRNHLALSLDPAAHQTDSPIVSYYGLYQWTLADLEDGAAEMARQTAAKLGPHMKSMCEDWLAGSRAEEQRLQRIRDDLVAEIERVRAERARRRGALELEVEQPAAEPKR